MMSADFLGQWFEHRSEFFHRTKNAVLRRTRAETERAADLLDRSPLVMAQRERGALERAQTFKRLRHAPLDFRAARHRPGGHEPGRLLLRSRPSDPLRRSVTPAVSGSCPGYGGGRKPVQGRGREPVQGTGAVRRRW